MALTLGLTGMDPATEAALKKAFDAANARLGGSWRLLPDAKADHVVVDMDSMYGPMSWLRLHAAGKVVIGLTAAPRTQADFRLALPFDANSLQRLLTELVPDSALEAVESVAVTDSGDTASPDQPATATRIGEPQTEGQAVRRAAEAVVVEDATTAVPEIPPPASTGPADQEPADSEPVILEPRTLTDWLASGRIGGRVSFERDGITLLLDLDQRQYFGLATLKPLATHVSSDVVAEDFTPIKDWDRQVSTLDDAQPLARLLWFGGLLTGRGKLVPGFDPEARYLMLKWPQTEREYPRHFRIATVMMRGPATLAEIAHASSVPLTEVNDFVNANLATGFADIERLPEPEVETRRPGLFGRLRGR